MNSAGFQDGAEGRLRSALRPLRRRELLLWAARVSALPTFGACPERIANQTNHPVSSHPTHVLSLLIHVLWTARPVIPRVFAVHSRAVLALSRAVLAQSCAVKR